MRRLPLALILLMAWALLAAGCGSQVDAAGSGAAARGPPYADVDRFPQARGASAHMRP